MTPAELEKVRKKYPVSAAVARLSLGLNLGTGGNVTKQNMEQTEKPACPPKRIRQSSKPLMNKLESQWCEVLRRGCAPGELLIQALRFRLGNGIWYKPDFVIISCAITAYEVKGPHSFRGGFENLKVAASLYPEVRWILVWKQDGKWQEQEVLP